MAKKKEEEDNRKKQQWTTATLAPVEDNSTSGTKSDAKEISEKEKLDPIRPAFAMQMGLKGMH